MKRIVIYAVLLCGVLLVPLQSSDVAKLRPVQVVALNRIGETVWLHTDTGDSGQGPTALAALQNLKDTTPALIYLDTASYLLVSQTALEDTQELRGALKNKVKVCAYDQNTLPEDTGRFLDIHGTLPMLKDWKTGDGLPVLSLENGRLFLLKKSEKNT